MRQAYLALNEHLLLIVNLSFANVSLSADDTSMSFINQHDMLVIAYSHHLINDSVEVYDNEVKTPLIKIVGKLVAFTGDNATVKSWTDKEVYVSVKQVTIVRAEPGKSWFRCVIKDEASAVSRYLNRPGSYVSNDWSNPPPPPRDAQNYGWGFRHHSPIGWALTEEEQQRYSEYLRNRPVPTYHPFSWPYTDTPLTPADISYEEAAARLRESFGLPVKILDENKPVKPLYSIGTWDSKYQKFSPQPGTTTPWLNVDIHGLRRHLKELRTKGYSCHRFKCPETGYVDSDPSVLVERTDGKPAAAILNSWLAKNLR